MASITIRELDDALKARLRVRAAQHGRSMEDEVRDILRMAVAMPSATSGSIVDSIRARIASTGGVELAIPAREPMRDLAVPEP